MKNKTTDTVIGILDNIMLTGVVLPSTKCNLNSNLVTIIDIVALERFC